MHYDNPKAYPVRKLYLNLLKKSNVDDWSYDFTFLTDDEHKNDDDHLWFRVGDVLDFDEISDAMKYLQKVNSYLEKLETEIMTRKKLNLPQKP
jgi:hypothetical protein